MSLSAAKASHSEWLAEVESRIGSIRSARTGEGQSLTQKQALGLVGEWYRWFVARHEDAPGDTESWEHLLNDLQVEQLALAPAGFQGIETNPRDWAWTQAPKVRARMRPVISETAMAGEFLASKGIVLSRDAGDAFLDVLDKAFVAAIHLLIRRSQDDYTPDEYPARFPAFVPENKRTSSGLSPMGLFQSWVKVRKPERATINRWRGVFLNLDKFFQGASVEEISETDARRWKDQLVTPRRSAHTVAEVWLNAAQTVFGWAHKDDIIKSNPLVRVSITVPRKKRHRITNAFEPEEIKTILRGSLAVEDVKSAFSATKRWVPWLCAYTGARAGEITQLRGRDVITRDGIHALHITPEAGSTKSGSARTIPLHEHLIELGFLKFVADKGNGPLFYNPRETPEGADDPTNPRRPRAVKARERLAAWVRSLGVTDPEIRPNHGWRHTFKQIADRHGMSERVSDVITGHRPVTVGRTYGQATLSDMATALHKFPCYEVD
jgi:integrase